MAAMAATSPFQAKRWSRREYDRLIELGFFGPEDRIELIGGVLMVAEPKGTAHETALGLTEDALRAAFGSGWVVRVGSPIAPDDDSEPEPDVSVVPGGRRDYRDAHPARPVLIVEVSESSLRFDRRRKGSLYARAGIADYWILNLIDRILEIYREPTPARSARFGWRYASVQVFGAEGAATPLAAPAARIAVADLLP
jgi:Uma2 family endonuclease